MSLVLVNAASSDYTSWAYILVVPLQCASSANDQLSYPHTIIKLLVGGLC